MGKRNVLRVVWVARAPLFLPFQVFLRLFLFLSLLSSINQFIFLCGLPFFLGAFYFSLTFLYYLHLLQRMRMEGCQSNKYIALTESAETFEKNKYMKGIGR